MHPKRQIFLTFFALRKEGADLAPIAQNWVTAKTNPHLQAAVKKTNWLSKSCLILKKNAKAIARLNAEAIAKLYAEAISTLNAQAIFKAQCIIKGINSDRTTKIQALLSKSYLSVHATVLT